MEGKDYRKFVELLIGIAEIYDEGFSPILLEQYWQALKAHDYEIVEKAIFKIVRFKKDQIFISFDDIRAMIRVIKITSHVRPIPDGKSTA